VLRGITGLYGLTVKIVRASTTQCPIKTALWVLQVHYFLRRFSWILVSNGDVHDICGLGHIYWAPPHASSLTPCQQTLSCLYLMHVINYCSPSTTSTWTQSTLLVWYYINWAPTSNGNGAPLWWITENSKGLTSVPSKPLSVFGRRSVWVCDWEGEAKIIVIHWCRNQGFWAPWVRF